jgi:hypothetical protein
MENVTVIRILAGIAAMVVLVIIVWRRNRQASE